MLIHIVNQKRDVNKDVALQSNVATVKNQRKLDTTKKLTNRYFSKTQSKICKSPTDKAYSYGQVNILQIIIYLYKFVYIN